MIRPMIAGVCWFLAVCNAGVVLTDDDMHAVGSATWAAGFFLLAGYAALVVGQ